MIKYDGEILGFRYMMEFNTDQEFEDWLIPKLEKRKFKAFEKRILQKLLGMDKLLDRIKAIEDRLK